MVKLLANSNSAPAETGWRDPIKQFLWDTVISLGAAGMADLEAEIDRQFAEAVATMETLQPGTLALALVTVIDKQPAPRVYDIQPGMTGGKDILRERMEARKAGYDDGCTAKAVWPEIRDQVLVQATLYFARIAAGWRLASRPAARSDRAARIVEKLWFMLRVLDRATPAPSGFFEHSIYDTRPELLN